MNRNNRFKTINADPEKAKLVDRSWMNNQLLCLKCNRFDFPIRIDKTHGMSGLYIEVDGVDIQSTELYVEINGVDVTTNCNEAFPGNPGWACLWTEKIEICSRCKKRLVQYVQVGDVRVFKKQS